VRPAPIARPPSLQLRLILERHESVKAVGAAMSHSRNQIGCAAAGGANIITAGLCEAPSLTAAMPFYLAPAGGTATLASSDIRVNETSGTATVRTCVTIQALLEFLAAYRTEAAPGGYALPYPSTTFVGQTVGGAIATATYGASLVHGSWSAKVLEARFMNTEGKVRTYMYMHICIYIYICVCVHTHTHTHI